MGNKCVKCVLPHLESQEEIQTDSRNKKNNFDSNDFGMNSNQNQLETDIKYKQKIKIQNLNQELDNIQSNKYNNKENENNINNENNHNNNDFLKLDNPITFENNDEQNFNLFHSNKVNDSVNKEENNNNKNEIIEDIDKKENSKNENLNLIDLNTDNNLPKDDFSKYIFEQINKIRKNPKDFIDIIKQSKSYITKDKKGKLIYKNKVKVALSEGFLIFDEAISFLEQCISMEELIFNPNICIPIPNNENDIKSKSYLTEKIAEINKNIPISSYWRDIITDPETSFILMIVDDTGKINRTKRNDILNPEYKYIGICSVTIGKTFGCYVTFSK